MTNLTNTNPLRTTLALSLGSAVALGFARFNYALLLPAMRQDLAWTYTQAGSMNTANALGYMFGALMAAPIGKRWGLARTFWVSMVVVGLAMLLTGIVSSFPALLIFRLLAGFAGATTFIIGATLASQLAGSGRGGLILGIYFSGIGLGVFLASVGLPQLLEQNLTIWRTAWVAILLFFVWIWLHYLHDLCDLPFALKRRWQQRSSYFLVYLWCRLDGKFIYLEPAAR